MHLTILRCLFYLSVLYFSIPSSPSHTRPAACDAFPFPFIFSTRTASALRRFLALRAPLVRSRPRLCALRQGQRPPFLSRMQACSLIYLARASSHIVLARPFPSPSVCATPSRIHSTLVAVAFDCRFPQRVIADSLTVVSGPFRDIPHRPPSSVLRQHGRHAATTAAPPRVAAVVAAAFCFCFVRRSCS